MAAATRSAVAVATPGSSLMTRETVFRLTPAASATSRIVGRVVRRAISALSSIPDNVVGQRCQGGPVRPPTRRVKRAGGRRGQLRLGREAGLAHAIVELRAATGS